jgi:starvation-inducible DNA-binding protein
MNLDFKIYTNALKAYENESGEKFVAGTTSSSIRDLHGDEMSLGALKSMADTARQNMTVFLNHNYNVPEDLFGSATDAEIVKRWDAETNQEVYDLDVNIRVVNEDENPEALRAYRAIKRGVKLGLSIGARVEKASRKAAQGDQPESIVIEKVRLLEASVVGIPANQRSYLHNAIKSIKSAGVDLDLLDNEEPAEKAAPDALETGDFVTWNSSGGAARGRITRVVKSGKVSIPDSDFTVQGTPEDPAALIRVYQKSGEGWAATETIVGHKFSTLRKIQPLKAGVDLIDTSKAVEVEGQQGADKAPLVGALYTLLSEATAFYLKAHGAHWNVVGEGFSQYHDLFEEIYEDAHASLDPIAESLRKLNSPAPAELKDLAGMVNSAPRAEDYEAESLAADLYAANEKLLENIMVAFKVASDANQQGIANFLAERQDMHQKWSWQLRASLAPEEEESMEDEKPEMPGDAPESEESSVENTMDSELEKKTRVTVTVSTDNEDKQPVAAPAVSEDETVAPEDKEEVKASATPDGEEDAPVEEPEEAEEPAKDPAVAALEALGAKLVEEEKSLDGDESSVQPEAAEAEVVVEAPVEEAPAAEVVEADVAPLEEVKSIAKSALDAANAAHEEVAALAAKVTELAESKAKVEEDLSKALDLIERISALGVGRKSVDVPQGIQVKAAETAPWLSPYVQRVLEAQKD